MVRIAICDDMPQFLQETEQLLRQWKDCPDDLHIQTFADADSLLIAHGAEPFHIIFLDVIMPLLNGIEAAKELRQTDRFVKLVFLTSSAEYAVDSYRVRADDYLLKPLDPKLLQHRLAELLEELRRDTKCLLVKIPAAVRRIAFRDIESVEAQNKHSLITLKDGSRIESIEPLYIFEDKLLPEDQFYKCHRSYLVNLFCIKSYSQKEILMRSGARIPISRGNHREFEQAYFALMFGKVARL